LVELDSTTRSRETLAACQPNRTRARFAASRDFSSSFRIVASADVSSVLISMTSKVRVSGCHARRSMDPDERGVS
jgi:hypothetical protein